MSGVDVTSLRAKWLQQCGPCDAGLPMACSHPNEDYRPAMADLLDDLEQLRAAYDDLKAARLETLDQRDEARARLARVEALHRRRPHSANGGTPTDGGFDFVAHGQINFPDLCDYCRFNWPCETAAALGQP